MLKWQPIRKKPFRVLFNDQHLDVLGTSFNINDYPEENNSVTTLIDGAVRLTTSIASISCIKTK